SRRKLSRLFSAGHVGRPHGGNHPAAPHRTGAVARLKRAVQTASTAAAVLAQEFRAALGDRDQHALTCNALTYNVLACNRLPRNIAAIDRILPDRQTRA